MKRNMRKTSVLNLLSLAFILATFASCQKENSLTSTDTPTEDFTQAIAVAASSTTAGDSVYVVGTCARGHRTDSISVSSLPVATTNYLSANYAGYTSAKAYTDKDSSGNVNGYVVLITYNGKPVGLKFDASGSFVRVLEQREGHDMKGRGWHNGGRFDDRDGKRRDTVAISALPAAITTYFAANYSQDTLVGALKDKDGSYVVVSINNGPFATVFDTAGAFIKRVELPARKGHANSIELTALPASAQSYLQTTYPNYVFKHAFQIVRDGVVEGYAVFIDANATKYGIWFDGNGSFAKAVTVR